MRCVYLGLAGARDNFGRNDAESMARVVKCKPVEDMALQGLTRPLGLVDFFPTQRAIELTTPCMRLRRRQAGATGVPGRPDCVVDDWRRDDLGREILARP